MDKKTNTKEIILSTASELFAVNGFDNTSIRDIATKADVNVASINYHFNSKMGLYRAVLDENINKVSERIEELAQESNSCEDFAIKVYKYYIYESNTFFNSMKMFLINHLPISKDIIPQSCIDDPMGPPGTRELMGLIKEETGISEDSKELYYASTNIFHNIIFTALVSKSSFVQALEKELNENAEEEKIESIRFNIRSTLKYLNSTK